MKVLLDTNVLIGFLRNTDQREEFESRLSRPLVFISSVVVLELFAGCRTPRQEKALESFLKPFQKAGRLITPDHGSFRDAGRVLAKLGQEGLGSGRLRQIVNDVLIAVTAAKAGLILVTANKRDFSLIEKYTPVRWMLPG